MKSETSAKKVQLEHSKAKVSLYTQYLSIYLNILSRAHAIEKVFIFDLMCGEGIYQDGSKGSALLALDKIRQFSDANPNLGVQIEMWLNDSGVSLVEKGRNKISRVEEAAQKIKLPPNVLVRYFDKDFRIIFEDVLRVVGELDQARAFVFIDPHGYKDVKPQDVRALLRGGKSEVLLFIPASFLYRFLEKSLDPSFSAGEPLLVFLNELFRGNTPTFTSIEDFIRGLKLEFKQYLSDMRVFVDTFTIQRDPRNLYCLYFFTSNLKGYEKMLEVKWRLDDQRGKGFRLEKTADLFSEVEANNYPQRLLEFVKSANFRTNRDVFVFGLENGYLAKHTKAAMLSLEAVGNEFELSPLDGRVLEHRAFHIGDDKRLISISLRH